MPSSLCLPRCACNHLMHSWKRSANMSWNCTLGHESAKGRDSYKTCKCAAVTAFHRYFCSLLSLSFPYSSYYISYPKPSNFLLHSIYGNEMVTKPDGQRQTPSGVKCGLTHLCLNGRVQRGDGGRGRAGKHSSADEVACKWGWRRFRWELSRWFSTSQGRVPPRPGIWHTGRLSPLITSPAPGYYHEKEWHAHGWGILMGFVLISGRPLCLDFVFLIDALKACFVYLARAPSYVE